MRGKLADVCLLCILPARLITFLFEVDAVDARLPLLLFVLLTTFMTPTLLGLGRENIWL